MSQTPSIGRMVHYKVQGHDQPFPAVITQVEEDGYVSLYVMSPVVGGYTAFDVRQGDDDFEWNWPPYVPPINKPDPKPVPTKDDVELILNDYKVTSEDMDNMSDRIMELFEDFLK